MKPAARAFSVDGAETRALVYRAAAPARGRAIVLAPGAGAGQEHAFLVGCARALAKRGIDVVTFDFLYRALGKRAPDRNDKLEACWRAAFAVAVEATGCARPFVGGKSMGGRIASQLCAAGLDAAGLVLLGYPLHPPKQRDKLRAAHLGRLTLPTLILQGERDPFGGPEELRAQFPATARIVGMAGGHSFEDAALGGAWEVVAEFVVGG